MRLTDKQTEHVANCFISFVIIFAICFLIYFTFISIIDDHESKVKINESNNAILHSMMEHGMTKEQIDMFIKSKTK